MSVCLLFLSLCVPMGMICVYLQMSVCVYLYMSTYSVFVYWLCKIYLRNISSVFVCMCTGLCLYLLLPMLCHIISNVIFFIACCFLLQNVSIVLFPDLCCCMIYTFCCKMSALCSFLICAAVWFTLFVAKRQHCALSWFVLLYDLHFLLQNVSIVLFPDLCCCMIYTCAAVWFTLPKIICCLSLICFVYRFILLSNLHYCLFYILHFVLLSNLYCCLSYIVHFMLLSYLYCCLFYIVHFILLSCCLFSIVHFILWSCCLFYIVHFILLSCCLFYIIHFILLSNLYCCLIYSAVWFYCCTIYVVWKLWLG